MVKILTYSPPFVKNTAEGSTSRPLFPQWSHHVYPQFLPGSHPNAVSVAHHRHHAQTQRNNAAFYKQSTNYNNNNNHHHYHYHHHNNVHHGQRYHHRTGQGNFN